MKNSTTTSFIYSAVRNQLRAAISFTYIDSRGFRDRITRLGKDYEKRFMSSGRGAYYKAKYGRGGKGDTDGRILHNNDSGQYSQNRSRNDLTADRTSRDLENMLRSIDGRQYGDYKQLQGRYEFEKPKYCLEIVHVQSDAFSPPSCIRVEVLLNDLHVPTHLYSTTTRGIALADFLARRFCSISRNHCLDVKRGGESWHGSKGGDIIMEWPTQHMLERTNVIIQKDTNTLIANFCVGLPARGRTIEGRQCHSIFMQGIPRLISEAFYWGNLDSALAEAHVLSAEDQQVLRYKIVHEGMANTNGSGKRRLCAFVRNGSLLPRGSGAVDTPGYPTECLPFASPPSLHCEFELPNAGLVSGMGIPEGVTLIVGGGFHGKSTLLSAIEKGVYDHIPGDGREFVVTDPTAVKIRAEDGRSVEGLDISAFINNLPNKKSTTAFTTANASGSTSQAANIIEYCEMGTKLLLLDEDSCATNFMSRDSLMSELVQAKSEPITTFLERVRELYEVYGVSSIIVVGGCGAYFSVADTVICMDSYIAVDVTERAKAIAASTQQYKWAINSAIVSKGASCVDGKEDIAMLSATVWRGTDVTMSAVDNCGSGTSTTSLSDTNGLQRLGHFDRNMFSNRSVDIRSLSLRQHGKVFVRDKSSIRCGNSHDDAELMIDLSAVEQLVEVGQLRAIAQAMERLHDDGKERGLRQSLLQVVDDLDAEIGKNGIMHLFPSTSSSSPYDHHIFHGRITRPRKLEVAAAINRWRKLKTAILSER